jgi:hypothetical protein
VTAASDSSALHEVQSKPSPSNPCTSVSLTTFLSRQASLQAYAPTSTPETPLQTMDFSTRVSPVTGALISTGCGHSVHAPSGSQPFIAPYSLFGSRPDRIASGKLEIDPASDYMPSDDGWCCSICDEAEAYEGNALLVCSNPACRVVVHQLCYGVSTVPTVAWYCDSCAAGLHTAHLSCTLCTVKGGAFKATDRGLAVPQTFDSLLELATTRNGPVLPLAVDFPAAIGDVTAGAGSRKLVENKTSSKPTRVSMRRQLRGMVDGDAVDGTSADVVDTDVPESAAAPTEPDAHPSIEHAASDLSATASLHVVPADLVSMEQHPASSPDELVSSEWVHVVCGVFVPEVGFGNVQTMSPIINLHRVNARRSTLVCRICKQAGGAVIQCSKGACGFSVHSTCARIAHLQMLFEYDQRSKQYRHAMHCPKHDDRTMVDLSRVPYADRCAFQRAEIRRLRQHDQRRQAAAEGRQAARNARHAGRIAARARSADDLEDVTGPDAIEDALAAAVEGAEDLLNYDSATESEGSSVMSDLEVPLAAENDDENRSVEDASSSSDDGQIPIPRGIGSGRGRRGRPRVHFNNVNQGPKFSMAAHVAGSARFWDSSKPFFRRVAYDRTRHRLHKYLKHHQPTTDSEECRPIAALLDIAKESVTEPYARLREREAGTNTLLPPNIEYVLLTNDRNTPPVEEAASDAVTGIETVIAQVDDWSIVSALSKLHLYTYPAPWGGIFQMQSRVPKDIDAKNATRILHALAAHPSMYPSFVENAPAEIDNRAIDAINYKPNLQADQYFVSYARAVGKDAEYKLRLPQLVLDSTPQSRGPSYPITVTATKLLNWTSSTNASLADPAFQIPALGCEVVTAWGPEAKSKDGQENVTSDCSIMFGGWGEGEDFTELRHTFAAEFQASMNLILSRCKSNGFVQDTSFRFATAEDANVLHCLNRVNEAFTSPADFQATIQAKNEFVLVATRLVTVNGKKEEHIVAFVNYYFSWFTDKSFPAGERPPPARVIYVATLQAVRPDTHADVCSRAGNSAVASAPTSPSRPSSRSSTPGSFSRLPSTAERRRQRGLDAESEAADEPMDGGHAAEEAALVSKQSKQQYPCRGRNPSSEPRTGTILLALALAHAKELGLAACLVDSTDSALPYYLQVVGMSPLVRRTPNKYHPMRIDLTLFDPLELACPAHKRKTTSPLSSNEADTSVVVTTNADDEVLAEMKDAQKLLEALMYENDIRGSILTDRVQQDEVELGKQSNQLVRRTNRRIWGIYYGAYERKAAAVEEERRKAEEEMDACCCICGGSDSMPKNQILFCDKCNLPVHQQCYGISVIPEGDWYCLPCAAGSKPSELSCTLCAVRGGALLACSDDTAAVAIRDADANNERQRVRLWMHVVCASLCRPLKVLRSQSENEMFVHGFKAPTNVDVFNKHLNRCTCAVCGSTEGLAHACCVPGCRGSVHGLCAIECGLVSSTGSQPMDSTVAVTTSALNSLRNKSTPVGQLTNTLQDKEFRYVANSSLPLHPKYLAQIMGPKPEGTAFPPLYFFCPSHRIPVPCRLQQGAQGISEALDTIINKVEPEASTSASGTTSDALTIPGVDATICTAMTEEPSISANERLVYFALHLASGTDEFTPNATGDVGLVDAIVNRKLVLAAAAAAAKEPSRAPSPANVSEPEDSEPVMMLEDTPPSATPESTPHAMVIEPSEDDDACAVCGDLISEPDNAIVFCDGCDLKVHQNCYGITTVPEGQWKCDTCVFGLPTKLVPCALCGACGGALKATDRGIGPPVPTEWAHVVCTIWVPEVRFADPTKMDLVTGVTDIPLTRWNLRCRVCKQKCGTPIQCNEPSCTHGYHVTCGLQAGYFFGFDDASGPASKTPTSTGKRARRRPAKGSSQSTDDEANEVVRSTFCLKHTPPPESAGDKQAMPACSWYPFRRSFDEIQQKYFILALRSIVPLLAIGKLGDGSFTQFRKALTGPQPALADTLVRAKLKDFLPVAPPPKIAATGRPKKLVAGKTLTPKAEPRPPTHLFRYPPIMPMCSNASSPLFQPLIRNLILMYDYKMNVNRLGTSHEVSHKFTLSANARAVAGVHSEASDRSVARRKRRRMNEASGAAAKSLSSKFDLSSLLDDIDEEERSRRQQLFGATSFLRANLPTLFGRDAISRAASAPASHAPAPAPRSEIREPTLPVPLDAVLLPGTPVLLSRPAALNTRPFVRVHKRVALLSFGSSATDAAPQLTSNDTSPLSETFPSPAAVFADSLSFKAAATVEIVKTDQHGNTVKENVALDDSRYCLCRKTYAEDSSVMVGCSRCEEWFHVGCLSLRVCPTHTPGYDPTSSEDPSQLTCLLTPENAHIDVRSDYVCPKCSGTRWGSSG